jgi:hypothetical protein
VAFDPDIATAAVGPVAFDPARTGAGGLLIGSGDPYVAVAVPAVVAGVPGPVAVFWWRGRDYFTGPGRGADTDNNLSLCNASGEKNCAGNNREEFLHRAISL